MVDFPEEERVYVLLLILNIFEPGEYNFTLGKEIKYIKGIKREKKKMERKRGGKEEKRKKERKEKKRKEKKRKRKRKER